jgi:hypothetical protein
LFGAPAVGSRTVGRHQLIDRSLIFQKRDAPLQRRKPFIDHGHLNSPGVACDARASSDFALLIRRLGR